LVPVLVSVETFLETKKKFFFSASASERGKGGTFLNRQQQIFERSDEVVDLKKFPPPHPL
jgi:hypothetical protein